MTTDDRPLSRSTMGFERPLDGALQIFRNDEGRELLEREMESPLMGERDTITLRKADDSSLLRVALRPGGTLPRHKVAGPFTLVVLSGSVTIVADGRSEVLNPLDVATCDPNVEHAVESITGSHLLLMVSGAPHHQG